jgi:hypothetical protein
MRGTSVVETISLGPGYAMPKKRGAALNQTEKGNNLHIPDESVTRTLNLSLVFEPVELGAEMQFYRTTAAGKISSTSILVG